jgi:hypothetical protein
MYTYRWALKGYHHTQVSYIYSRRSQILYLVPPLKTFMNFTPPSTRINSNKHKVQVMNIKFFSKLIYTYWNLNYRIKQDSYFSQAKCLLKYIFYLEPIFRSKEMSLIKRNRSPQRTNSAPRGGASQFGNLWSTRCFLTSRLHDSPQQHSYPHTMTDWLTLWSKAPLGKLTVAHITRRLSTMFTKACNWFLFWEELHSVHSMHYFSKIRFNIILPSTSVSSKYPFYFRIFDKNLYIILANACYMPHPSYPWFDRLAILRVCGEWYKLRSSALCRLSCPTMLSLRNKHYFSSALSCFQTFSYYILQFRRDINFHTHIKQRTGRRLPGRPKKRWLETNRLVDLILDW